MRPIQSKRRAVTLWGQLGSLILMGLLLQCSDSETVEETGQGGAPAKSMRAGKILPRQDSRPIKNRSNSTQAKDIPKGTPKDMADRHLAWLAGSDRKSLDRVFIRFSLRQPDKNGKTLCKGSAWLSRAGLSRLALRRGEEATQLSFLKDGAVRRGPPKGPFVPPDEKETLRMRELELVLQTVLAWDLLHSNARLDLNSDAWLRSRIQGHKNQSDRVVERRLDAKARLIALRIDGKDYTLRGERTGLHGSLPQHIRLPLAGLVLNIEAWLTKATFKPGYLDPDKQSQLQSALVMGEEAENSKPTLREYGSTWEVVLKDPVDWEGRVRLLTQEIPQPFLDAGLQSAALPTLTNNGKMLLHVRRADGKAARPKAPKGYRLERRPGRVSAVVYVTCTWPQAEKALLTRLEPYIQKLGLRARGPLWMSPYLNWAQVQEGPQAQEKIKIRGEIRVR